MASIWYASKFDKKQFDKLCKKYKITQDSSDSEDSQDSQDDLDPITISGFKMTTFVFVVVKQIDIFSESKEKELIVQIKEQKSFNFQIIQRMVSNFYSFAVKKAFLNPPCIWYLWIVVYVDRRKIHLIK